MGYFVIKNNSTMFAETIYHRTIYHIASPAQLKYINLISTVVQAESVEGSRSTL